MTLNKREKGWLILAVIIITFVSLGKFVIQPGVNNYLAVQNEIREGKHELHKKNLIIRDKKKYENMLEETLLELEMVKKAFYQDEITKVKLKLMEEIDRLIKESELIVKSKEIRVENPEEEPVIVSYLANLSGIITDLVDFLKLLTLQDKYYQVQELEIKGRENEGELNIYLVIETYCIGGMDYGAESN